MQYESIRNHCVGGGGVGGGYPAIFATTTRTVDELVLIYALVSALINAHECS